jgi:predicted cupin superfamily sugar epimerase
VSEPLTADEVIAHLGLKPHPEGGWFRETFRDGTGLMVAPIPPPFSFS